VSGEELLPREARHRVAIYAWLRVDARGNEELCDYALDNGGRTPLMSTNHENALEMEPFAHRCADLAPGCEVQLVKFEQALMLLGYGREL
jgi:hypothetical protein